MSFTEIIVAVLGADALFRFIEFLIKRHDQKKNKVTPEQKAIRNILARDLMIDMKEWLHADVRSADDWEIIHNNFESYTELGGNGKIKKLYEECASLSTTE